MPEPKKNYDLMMEQQMKAIAPGTPLLLHACCAPCSSAVLERLADFFKITVFFYNPNITEKEEYEKRLGELRCFCRGVKSKYPVSVLEGKYDPESFFEIAKGLENRPERGRRCYKCYRLRLAETAKVAREKGFEYYTTTLSISPHKNARWLNTIGENLNGEYSATFLYSDFKKHNGYKRSIELSARCNLYRQDYCGCIYSKAERERQKADKEKQETDL